MIIISNIIISISIIIIIDIIRCGPLGVLDAQLAEGGEGHLGRHTNNKHIHKNNNNNHSINNSKFHSNNDSHVNSNSKTYYYIMLILKVVIIIWVALLV